MKIAIITDGGSQLGMGHIYQSIVLAGLLSQSGQGEKEIFFVTKSSESVRAEITNKGFKVWHCSDDNDIFDLLKRELPARIIFDKLDVSPELAKKIKEGLDAKLVICTNLTEANNYADICVKADFDSNFENIFKKDEETGRVEIFGPKYWILRDEFYKLKKKSVDKNLMSVEKILLIFGGADPCNFSSTVLNELLKMDKGFDIKIILGTAFKNQEELDNVLFKNASSKSNAHYFRGRNDIAELMHKSDVVFASPGLSFFEALAVGTPVVGFHQDDCQRDYYKGIFKTYGQTEVSKVPSLIETKDFTFPSDPFVSKLEIGEGRDEIINEIFA